MPAPGLKYPVVTGETGGDDALLKSFGDEAIGLVSCCPYTLDLDTDGNKRFIDGMLKNYNTIPGFNMPRCSTSIARWSMPP